MTRHPSARIQARSHPRAALWLGPPVAPELCAGLCAESGCRGIRNLVLSMWREKRQPHERKPVLAGHPTTPSRPPCRCGGRSSTVRAANVTRGGRNNSARAGVSPADGRHSDRRRTAERPPTYGRATPDVRQSDRRRTAQRAEQHHLPTPAPCTTHRPLVLPSKCVRSAPSSLPRRVLDPRPLSSRSLSLADLEIEEGPQI